MSRAHQGFPLSVLISPYFWVSVALESLLVILAVTEVPAVPLALLGAGFIICSLVLAYASHSWRQADPIETPAIAHVLTDNAQLMRLFRAAVGEALTAVAGHPEGNRKDAITDKLIALGVQFRAVASGARALGGSESWYVAHDAILTIPDLKEYRAAVYVRNHEIARDSADQESLRATFAAVRRGVLVERILVLPEVLWPGEQLLPADIILPWIEEQQTNLLRVILVRERDLPTEPEFSIDTCMFNDWGVGTRDLDDRSQTVRVSLDFTSAAIRTALDRLERLSQIGIPFGDLLDRADRTG